MGDFRGQSWKWCPSPLPTPHWPEIKHMASPSSKAKGKCSPGVHLVHKGEIHISVSPSKLCQSGIVQVHLETFKLGSVLLGP